MPKIRRKDRQERKMVDDKDSGSDDASICSNVSEAGTEGDMNENDLSSAEVYEDKIDSCLEALLEKNLKTRIEGLRSLKSGLSKKFAFDFLLSRSLTISDSLDKCVKRGKEEEQKLAAECQAILLVQLSPDSTTTLDLFNKIVLPTFRVLISDNSASLEARCACVDSLSLCAFFAFSDQLDIRQIADFFLELASTGQQAISLQVSAIKAWSLLFTLLTPEYVHAVAPDHLLWLTSRLESSSTEIRIAAGEAIAVVFEAALATDESFEYHYLDNLCEALLQLSKESTKSIGKKDKKMQKASFREVLKFVEEGDFKDIQITISRQEHLLLQSWSQYLLYEILCATLKSGTPIHLKENPVVRDMFDLGEVLLEGVGGKGRGSKYDKYVHKSSFKQLTKFRQKQRNKKSNLQDFRQ